MHGLCHDRGRKTQCTNLCDTAGGGHVGAGPAGLSAAIEAAKRGLKVVVFDENEKPGGQLFKQIHKFFGSKEHKAKIRGFVIGDQLLQEAGAAQTMMNLHGVKPGEDEE